MRQLEKDKVLLICRNYQNPISACGICAYSIVKEFRKRGFKVWVLSISEMPYNATTDEGLKYIFIQEDKFTTINRFTKYQNSTFPRLLYKLRYYLRLPIAALRYPVSSNSLTNRIYHHIKDLVDSQNIGLVVSTFSPYEPIVAAMKIKKLYKNSIRVVTYHLDPLLLPRNNNSLINRFKLAQGKKAVRKEASIVDNILAQQSTEKYFTSPIICYVDFPLYERESISEPSDFTYPNNCINITYVGTLDINNRNPLFFFKLIDEAIKKHDLKNVVVHIWGFISDGRVNDIIKQFSFVRYHGTIDSIYVSDILKRSDILLNLSNMLSYLAIPSKIFQLFCAERPIINIVRHPKDYAKKYFEIYPLVVNINEYEGLDERKVKEVAQFVRDNSSKVLSVDDALYLKSKPSYIVDRIISDEKE